ncbi:MAG: hypothetical protein RSD95_12545, partial [Clostridia bacterium]
FHRNKNGVGWFKITWLDLARYSGNMMPICGECLNDLVGRNNITLIPILNEAYCPKCAPSVLKFIDHICDEDKPIADRRERFYADYFGCSLEVP